jgi:hypothetical protein
MDKKPFGQENRDPQDGLKDYRYRTAGALSIQIPTWWR